LYRAEPINDEVRIPHLQDSAAEIEDTFKQFQGEGIIGTVGSFPYTVPFGRTTVAIIPSHAGWITYFNVLEQEYIQNLPAGQWLIGLRPLAAGKIFEQLASIPGELLQELVSSAGTDKKEDLFQLAINFCLTPVDRVKTNVLSIHTLPEAQKLFNALTKAEEITKTAAANLNSFIHKKKSI
jgi:hypothetical protein